MLSRLQQHGIVIGCAIVLSLVTAYVYPDVFGFQTLLQPASRLVFNGSGVPFVDYGEPLGLQRNPVTISQFALANYDIYAKTNNGIAKQHFIDSADWLVEYANVYGNYSLYHYNFPWDTYELPSGWRSGMAQGQAIQVLLKAHEVTKDMKYLETSRLLLNAFFVDVHDGGVRVQSENGWWYEEYAHEKGLQSRALNGMIFALFGIHDYYLYTGDTNAKYLFDKGIDSLKAELPLYDFEGFSYYDRLERPAGKYHNIHVQQTEQLYEMTQEEIFSEFHDKWQSYIPPITSISKSLLAAHFVLFLGIGELILLLALKAKKYRA